MKRIAGVRFREAGKIYYFDPGELEVEEGDHVVVETPRGLEIARVVIAPDDLVFNEVTDAKPIVRLAEEEDMERWEEMKAQARGKFEAARKFVLEKNAPVKVAGADYDLDGRNLVVYYTAEDRPDARDVGRDLQKDLSRELGQSLQLRQIGPRDQAKLVDGYGICGRRLCCASWLTNFPSISIKMAKEQDLPLNPTKISGECGRLLCCLSYENDQYKEMRSNLPSRNQMVETPMGIAKVVSINILRQSVVVVNESMTTTEYPVGQIGFQRRDGGMAVPVPAEAAIIEEMLAPAERQPVSPTETAAVPTAEAGEEGAKRRRRRRRGGRRRHKPGEGPAAGEPPAPEGE